MAKIKLSSFVEKFGVKAELACFVARWDQEQKVQSIETHKIEQFWRSTKWLHELNFVDLFLNHRTRISFL